MYNIFVIYIYVHVSTYVCMYMYVCVYILHKCIQEGDLAYLLYTLSFITTEETLLCENINCLNTHSKTFYMNKQDAHS